jgi:hypothetical protein
MRFLPRSGEGKDRLTIRIVSVDVHQLFLPCHGTPIVLQLSILLPWQIVENGWVAGAFWRGAWGGQEGAGSRNGKAARVSGLFRFLCPYYQNTKFGGKTGQNSLRLLWWKPWGIREKTLVPYAESLTSFPHLGVWGGALFFWQTVRLQYASDFYPRMRDSRGTSLVPETPLDPVRGRSRISRP